MDLDMIPSFFPPERGCSTAELPPEEKNNVSHRGNALRSMKLCWKRNIYYNKWKGLSNMKVLIVSDTHGHEENFEKVLEKVGNIQHLIHLGDVEGHEDI